MTDIILIHVGDFKEDYFRRAQAEYEKRLGGFCRFRCVCIKEEREGDSAAENEKALRREGERIFAAIPDGAYVFALCVEGEQMSSEAFAAGLEGLSMSVSRIVFIIGSSRGLSAEVKNRADKRRSFSKMTLPHRLMRIVLTEQIYRAFMINAGREYHK